MPTFSFRAHVSGVDISRPRFEDAFYRSGCDDALIIVIDGELKLDFDRDAPSFEDATACATADIEGAGGHVDTITMLESLP